MGIPLSEPRGPRRLTMLREPAAETLLCQDHEKQGGLSDNTIDGAENERSPVGSCPARGAGLGVAGSCRRRRRTGNREHRELG